MHMLSIKEMMAALETKQFSAVELTQYYLDRIEKFNPQLNSFLFTADNALEHAKKVDTARSQGGISAEEQLLAGIPLAHKDIFCVNGMKTTCASKMLDNFIAPYDATVVAKFNQAQMIMLGKTNMDEFAMGSSNENSYDGPAKNPWDLERVPGGSSGGSAVAVAARLCPVATGTDTGGSIRQPAALCGITGLKPTYGRVSRYGMVAFASSLDQGGLFTLTAEDCAYVLQAMAGFDPKDSTSLNKPVPNYAKALEGSLQGVKIGLPKEYFAEGLQTEIKVAIEEAIKVYQDCGAEMVEISLPHKDYAIAAYYIIASAECSSNLARYDGVRYGYRCDNPRNLEDMYKRSRGEAFGPEVKRRIMIGTYALSTGYYDAYYLKAQKVRHLISEDFQKAFEKVDVILGPTTPTTAFKLGEKVEDPVKMYLADIYTIAVNLAGLPGLSIPAGFADGLPIGMQLIGNYLQEDKLLNVAHQYQQQTQWHKQIPTSF